MKYKHRTKAFPFGEGGTAIAVMDEGVIYLFSYHLAEVILFAKLYVCSKKCIIPRQWRVSVKRLNDKFNYLRHLSDRIG